MVNEKPLVLIHNAMKAPHRYAVQGSDTTMMPIAVALPGQKPCCYFDKALHNLTN